VLGRRRRRRKEEDERRRRRRKRWGALNRLRLGIISIAGNYFTKAI
jgi:hypothetical protein